MVMAFLITLLNCIILHGERLLGKLGGSKRHSLQAVELSQRTQAVVQIVSNLPSNGGPIYRVLGMPAVRTRWMAVAVAHKSG